MTSYNPEDLPFGTLVFAKEDVSTVVFDNAQVQSYSEDKTMIEVKWLQRGTNAWIKNDSSLIYSAQTKRKRTNVQRFEMTTMNASSYQSARSDEQSNSDSDKRPNFSSDKEPRQSVKKAATSRKVIIDSDDNDGEFKEEDMEDSSDSDSESNNEDDMDDSNSINDENDVTKSSSKKSSGKTQSSNQSGVTREECEAAVERSFQTMVRHRSALEPFVTPKVFAKLRHFAAEGKNKNAKKVMEVEEVVEQPHTLSKTCTMRPYQIEGLSWLVRQYDTCVNSILGDEMGLGKLYKLYLQCDST